MSWTTGSDLKAQARRLWERGELLRPLVNGETRFPLRLAFRGPSSADLAERFDTVRSWIAELAQVAHIRIEWREVNHRILGAQRVPQSIWIDSLDQALALAGRRSEAARFAQVLEQTRSERPELADWLRRRPLQAIELADQWPRLLAVVKWISEHPQPGIYLRQADIPGVDTKFTEAHRAVLAELLDLALPPDAIDAAKTGVSQFSARYGFRDRPTRIRFRPLDDGIRLLPGPVRPDVTVDAASFARLQLGVRRVFITENETNFLAFPDVADAIVVFGAGYGWDALAQARWLADCAIHYWGDIDTHGFEILDQLRSRFAHVESLLMDRATLMAHESSWGREEVQVARDLPRLTDAERTLFDDLRDNRIRSNLRLEQERIGFGWLIKTLQELTGDR